MKLLIIDREDISAQIMNSRLAPLGHKIIVEPIKNNAVERIQNEDFDIVFVDPAPLNSARPLILNLRRATKRYPYIIQLGQNTPQMEAIQSGANDALLKPIDPDALDLKMDNAKYLTSLIKRIGNSDEDFPSAGGIIAKSAFNQLFLSAIDRADRYGEQTFIIFIRLANYKNIFETEGRSEADIAAAKLSNYLVRLRRQSDIVGQTASYEFTLLLQRPAYETEPNDAANRFAEALTKIPDLFKKEGIAPEIEVTLINLPIGERIIHHQITRENLRIDA